MVMSLMKPKVAVVGIVLGLALITAGWVVGRDDAPVDPLQAHAEEFVRLALALDRLHEGEVDAYFGPPELDARNAGSGPDLGDIAARTADLLDRIREVSSPSAERRERLERRVAQLSDLISVIREPGSVTFAEEARLLYGIELSVSDQTAAEQAMQQLDEVLPGRGSLAFRFASFSNRMAIPPDRRQAVFERALEECRARTLARWDLPMNDSISIEWSRDVGAAWHRYEGEGSSTLRLNPLGIASVGAAMDLACHEGYPGHHAQFTAMEHAAGPEGLVVEDTLVLLRSPESVLREGAAEYGVDLVFPPDERRAFARSVLFPLAGLPPSEADLSATVHELSRALAPLAIPILRGYRDGDVTFNQATVRLQSEALVTSPSGLLGYIDQFGAYSTGYTVAYQRVRDHIRSRSASSGDGPWTALNRLLTDPDVVASRVLSGE